MPDPSMLAGVGRLGSARRDLSAPLERFAIVETSRENRLGRDVSVVDEDRGQRLTSWRAMWLYAAPLSWA